MREKFTQEENNIVDKLEVYARQLDRNIGTGEEIDFDELFSFLKYTNTLSIDKAILTYSDYLYGVALPMYDLLLTEIDFVDQTELGVVTKASCWVDVLEKSSGVDFNELNERLGKSISEKIKPYIKDYNQLWAVIMGYKHYYYIKKHRLETGNKSPYLLSMNKIESD